MYLFSLLKASFKNAFAGIFAISPNRVNWYCGRINKQMNLTTTIYILCGLDSYRQLYLMPAITKPQVVFKLEIKQMFPLSIIQG